MGTRHIYFVRHGEYDWDNQPHPMKGLTLLGKQQAQFTAERLSSLSIATIYSSDLQRAIETAEIIGRAHPDVPHKQSPDLRECLLPCASFADAPRELLKEGQEQAERAFSEYLRPTEGDDSSDIIVSHGNLIRYLVVRVLRASPQSWLRMKTSNCGVTEIAVEPDGRLWLVTYNDVGHLPREFTTAGMPARAKAAAGTDSQQR
jgi:serine/threonine-protein phosphatase PGAM5